MSKSGREALSNFRELPVEVGSSGTTLPNIQEC